VPCSWQQFHELQLGTRCHARVLSSSFMRCSSGQVLLTQPSSSFSSGRALPQQQFNEVLSSDGGALLQAKGERVQAAVERCDGHEDRRRRRSAGGIQVAANGLEGCAG